MKQPVPSLVLAFLILLPLAVPVSGVTACTAPAQCLTVQQAAELFGAGNYVQVSREPCGYLTDAAGARNPQYCFERAAATSPLAPGAPGQGNAHNGTTRTGVPGDFAGNRPATPDRTGCTTREEILEL